MARWCSGGGLVTSKRRRYLRRLHARLAVEQGKNLGRYVPQQSVPLAAARRERAEAETLRRGELHHKLPPIKGIGL